jgi:NADPH oxidase 2
MPLTFNRSSGLDFSDGRATRPPTYTNGIAEPSHLQRNRTERRRLQGLQRNNTISAPAPITEPRTLRQKWDHWMINDGGKRLFFGVWILLHLLVAGLGFVNYQLKDNSVNARKTYGITFGNLSLLLTTS